MSPVYADLSIEARLESTLPDDTNHLLLARAYQLKRFGQCPRCGQRGISRHHNMTMNRAVYFCRALRCGWNAIVADLDLVTAQHPDDVLVRICRDEPTKGGG